MGTKREAGTGNIYCPYCGEPAENVNGEMVYPHRPDLFSKKFILCRPCNAYVGCHPNTNWKPLGRLANKELRKWKINAHAVFDPIWQSKRMSRSEAYERLAKKMGIEKVECHIGEFDVDQCKKVVEIIRREN